jgi:glycosyltransferase involved in cell wall biosynthesis
MAKIAIFLPSLGGGGAERVAITLASGFMDRGFEFDFVLVKKAGENLRLVPHRAQMIDLRASRTLTALPRLVKYLRDVKPDALIAGLDHVNLIALWAKILSRSQSKVLIGNHTHLSSAIRSSPKLQEKIYPLLLHLFYTHADAIMSVSDGSADDLAKVAGIPRNKIQTIYNPFPISEIVRMSTEPLDHPWFAAGQPPVILTVGRLSNEKDYSTLIKAFAALRKQREARLIILGTGKERSSLMALAEGLGIRDDLYMPGFCNNPYAYMSRSRVFALSSKWEGLSTVLIEALICGTQVVSTDCPSGPGEILSNGKFGRLVPVGDPASLAAAMEEAINQPIPAERLRERAAMFTVDRAVDKYLRALGMSQDE